MFYWRMMCSLYTHIMKPFSGYHAMTKALVRDYRHSRARRIVENAFGLLESVFRIFRKPLWFMVNVENAEIITTACIYFHNFLKKNKSSRHIYCRLGTLDSVTKGGNCITGSWRTHVQNDTGIQSLSRRARSSTFEAKAVRGNLWIIFSQMKVVFRGRIFMPNCMVQLH